MDLFLLLGKTYSRKGLSKAKGILFHHQKSTSFDVKVFFCSTTSKKVAFFTKKTGPAQVTNLKSCTWLKKPHIQIAKEKGRNSHTT
jgi:hypothetical protein